MGYIISELGSNSSPATTDLVPNVDTSDTSMASSGTTKKSTLQQVADFLASLAQTLTNKDLSSATNTFPSSFVTDTELSTHESDTSTHGVTTVAGIAEPQTLTDKTLTSPVINTGISGTGIASGAEITTGTVDTKIVTPKAIADWKATPADGTKFLSGLGTWLVNPSFKLGTFTRDTAAVTGDVAYTGVGFTPRLIIFFGAYVSSVTTGFSDGTSHYLVGEYGTDNYYSHSSAVRFTDATGGNAQGATVKTLDADGFTLAWTKTGTPTGNGTCQYLAFK